jgi:hypothetical protein
MILNKEEETTILTGTILIVCVHRLNRIDAECGCVRPIGKYSASSSEQIKRQSSYAQRAHTLAPNEKKLFGRISLSLLDFRWAPD